MDNKFNQEICDALKQLQAGQEALWRELHAFRESLHVAVDAWPTEAAHDIDRYRDELLSGHAEYMAAQHKGIPADAILDRIKARSAL